MYLTLFIVKFLKIIWSNFELTMQIDTDWCFHRGEEAHLYQTTEFACLSVTHTIYLIRQEVTLQTTHHFPLRYKFFFYNPIPKDWCYIFAWAKLKMRYLRGLPQCRRHGFDPWSENQDATCCIIRQKKQTNEVSKICVSLFYSSKIFQWTG